MCENQSGLEADLQQLERGAGRSALFYWMVDNHDRLAAAGPAHSLRWRALCAGFRALGLTDAHGRRPSVAAARDTWAKARKTVQLKRLVANGRLDR